MNEGKTTAIFAAIAAVSFGLAFWSRPGKIANQQTEIEAMIGTSLFPKFEDPATASSLQIVKYDESLGQLEKFEVAKDAKSSLWKLPSYDDYPADATEQVRDATTPLIGLQILRSASSSRGDHSLYGVVNPDSEDLSVSESGVGMLVRVQDADDKVLASLIVGKEVEKAPNQRYVRKPSEDAVYEVEIDMTPFTTEFTAWIDGKLLDVSSFDITSVGLRDYAVIPIQGGYGLSRNYDADLAYDADESKWSLDRYVVYDGKTPVDTVLAEGEALQDSALNDLRNAVQDLEIVSVRRKPTGLAADLKADKSLFENEDSIKSLQSQGFFPQETPDGVEILATGGETLIGTDEGVQYLLRFGESEASLVDTDEETDDNGIRRYLLVMAQVDDSKFPYPELEVQPETVEEMLRMQKAQAEALNPVPVSPTTDVPPAPGINATQETPEVDTSDNAAPVEGESPASETSTSDPSTSNDGGSSEAKSTEDNSTASESSEAQSEQPDGSGDEPESTPEVDPNDCGPQQEDAPEEIAEAPPGGEATQPEASQTESADAEQETAAGESSDDEPVEERTQEELEEELEAVRERIGKENQRLLDDRQEKRDAALKSVQELNARFSDWYYVVSDSVYKKLKVSKDQLIQLDGGTPAAPPSIPPGGFGGQQGVPPGLLQQLQSGAAGN